MKPHPFGKYRYCLDHAYGRLGVTPSVNLPALRIQPRAEFLHGTGPRGAVEWFRNNVEDEFGPVLLTVNRLDLFADFQGWKVSVDGRHQFVCRATDVASYEADARFNGLQFGKRGSGTVSARLYDKTVESEKTGSGYWKDIWGEAFDPDEPVLRVEFEIGREALRQYGLDTPQQVFDATGALWGSLTDGWLSHRTPSSDATGSRWPVSTQWEAVRRARIGEDGWGIARMYEGKRSGRLHKLVPGLVGYLTSFGALTNNGSFDDVVTTLSDVLSQYAHDSGKTLNERIEARRRELGLP